MKTIVFAACILFCIINLSQSRPSFYYSNKVSNGYHAPYDFIDSTNNADSSASCNPLCDPSTETIQSNGNSPTNSGQCSNSPSFFSQQTDLPGLTFDSCCGFYQSCAQTCGNTKEYCDQQFYGCIWSQCGDFYRVRPGDRIICRSYATCFASYMVSNMTCDQFNSYQAQACSCVSNGNTVPIPSSSSSPIPGNPSASASPAPGNPSASSTPITALSTSPSNSVSPSIGASLSSSPLPVGKRQATTNSTDSSTTIDASQSTTTSSMGNNNGMNSGSSVSGQNYVSRVVPQWSTVYSQCPPSINNYINVMSDQEMDDIMMWNSGSSLKFWWDLF